MNFRLDIQGLRALAVIFVVIFHIQHQWLPGGFIGVDMFFVISGFLISKGLIKQKENKTFKYLEFIFGRVKRIVPAYLIMLLLSTIVAYFILVPADLLALLYDLRTSFIFTSNQVFANLNDYFGAKSYEKAFLHTWSLSIEMQFYFVLPFLIVYLPKSVYKWLLVIGALLVFIYTQYQIDVLGNKSGMYFSLLARSSEFIVGIAVNFIPYSTKLKANQKNNLALTALLVLILSGYLINESSSFPGLLALPACLATALLIWLQDSKLNNFLGNRSLAYIGTLSYSLYLWHWPILALYRYYCSRYDLTIIELFGIVPLIILFTLFSYYLIEEPFRKSHKKKFLFYLGILIVLILIAWFFGRRAMNDIQKVEMVYTSPSGFNINNHAKYEGYFLMGDTLKNDDRICLIGDSHALVMTSFFGIVGKGNNFNFSYISTNSYAALDGINDNLVVDEYKKQYQEAIPISNTLISKSKIIIVVKQWQRYNEYSEVVLEKLIDKLNPDQNLIIVSDFPKINKNPVREYKSITKPKDFKRQTISFPEIPKEIKELINKHQNVYLLELKSEKFFENAPFYNDTLMYYDESHINHYGSENYAKFEGYKLAELIAKLKAKKR